MKILTLILLTSLVSFQTQAAVVLVDKDQWKISMGGFVEFDTIMDSTRSFVETMGNAAVSHDPVAGQTGRTQMSVRNTRLSFLVEAPENDGWNSKGLIEGDFLGYDPAPNTQSEAAFFNNPTFRIRHAYLATEKEGWQFMGGQYWMLFGWQPYYFMPTIEVAPIAAMLYGRTTQARFTKTENFADNNTLQVALGVMRPPQRDAAIPGFESGLRFAFGGRSAGFTGGGTGAQRTQPMSIGVTALVREFVLPRNTNSPTSDLTHFPSTALAIDALIPVIASSDGKDVSNTLSVGGEFSTGTGYGDQFNSWTGGTASPIASGSSATTPEKNVNLDGGIGDFDQNGNFHLIRLNTINTYFQYHLPAETKTFFSGGYGRLYSSNIADLTLPSGKTGAGSTPYTRDAVFFGNVVHDFTKQFRLGLELAHTETTYSDAYIGHNNRYQLTAYFMF